MIHYYITFSKMYILSKGDFQYFRLFLGCFGNIYNI